MTGTYNMDLVLLSIAVAMSASYGALTFAARVGASAARGARWWIIGGAFVMGAGIWSMHFIGMLAFKLPIPMAYDLTLTMASLLLAIGASGFALAVVGRLAMISQDEPDPPILIAGGVIMGASICGMHYTGMAAMRMAPPIEYTPLLFGASMLIAVGASVAALWLAFTLQAARPGRHFQSRALAAAVMGLAISGMHYTAMAAAKFAPNAICAVPGNLDVDGERLALLIAGLAMVMLAVALLAALADARSARAPETNLP